MQEVVSGQGCDAMKMSLSVPGVMDEARKNMQLLSVVTKALLTIVLNCLLVLQDLALVDEPLVFCWDVALSGYRCFELCDGLLWGHFEA